MVDASQIQEHMEVKGSDGKHVGTVDHMDNGRIKLTKSDPASGGQHHYLDLNVVKEIKGGAVCLSKSAEEARRIVAIAFAQKGGGGLVRFGGAHRLHPDLFRQTRF